VESGQAESTKHMELSLLTELSNRPANKRCPKSKATETSGHTKISSTASLTSKTFDDFQRQAGKAFW
ncbi:hypothetical protein Bpfe_025005, partial [Biomphalaria pfeifferi]